MQTITLTQPGHFTLTDTAPPPPPRSGEALVRVRRIGVCGTDLHAYRGRQPFFTYPRILGHELGVQIVEIGPNDRGLAAGDRCTVEPYLTCATLPPDGGHAGLCIACRSGRTNCCARLQCLGVHTDGGMRELITVPFQLLHKSDRLSLDQLALVETLGIGCHAVDRTGPLGDRLVLVLGAGPIGLAVIQFARLQAAEVAVLNVRPDRLDFCRRLGVAHCIDARHDPLGQIEELSGGDLAAFVFDATGNAESMTRSFDYAAHGGRVVFVGLVQSDVTFHDPHFHRRELTLLASRNSTAADFHRIIRLIEEGRIDTMPWITHRAAFGRMISAFPTWLGPQSQVVKALIEI